MTDRLKRTDDVGKIKGIGAKKKERLAAMGIETVGDLLEHVPFRYQDRQRVIPIRQIPEDRDVLVAGVLQSKRLRRFGGSKSMVECGLMDDDTVYHVVFFNMPFIVKTLEIGARYVAFGKMKWRNGVRVFTNPEFTKEGSPADVRGIMPIYRRTTGISVNEISKWIRYALDHTDLGQDWLSEELRQERRLCTEEYAYREIHHPETPNNYKYARYRLMYDHLLVYQYALWQNRLLIDSESSDSSIEDVSVDPFVDAFPFTLTEGQQTAVRDIEADLIRRRPMNRLIQGDVGCGKTAVAETAIYKVVASGKQAAFMAPTEILAKQHYAKLTADFEAFGYRTALLVSGLKASERRKLLEDLESGAIDILIGTHALLQDDVQFSDLGLVITDEQHRFGVNQRKTLAKKAGAVNVLVMTATPIPRTLAATVFGDMDFTIIRFRPASRKPIITRAVTKQSRGRAYTAAKEQLEQGYGVYVVAPSIENNEENELSSAEALYDEMKKKFRGVSVGLIHGRMDKAEKDQLMADFAEGKIRLLVSTVVIEVGIDVPSATMMIIENAERFGLAQLHQLRGRVGRNSVQSYCYLVCYSNSDNAKARMKAMTEISDGFAISEEDFRLRGAGDLMGTMQSGMAVGGLYDLFRNPDLLELAGADAKKILTDPTENSDRSELDRRAAMLYSQDNSNII